VEISGNIAKSRYTETFYYWNIQITRGPYRIVETYVLVDMAIHVYEYGRGGKCVYMFKYTYAGVREKKMKMEKKNRHKGRVMRTLIGTVT